MDSREHRETLSDSFRRGPKTGPDRADGENGTIPRDGETKVEAVTAASRAADSVPRASSSECRPDRRTFSDCREKRELLSLGRAPTAPEPLRHEARDVWLETRAQDRIQTLRCVAAQK